MTDYYDFKVLTEKKVLTDEDYVAAWKQICNGLIHGKDFHTVSMHPRKNAPKKWFRASSDESKVLIQKAKEHPNESNLTMSYQIRLPEFEIVSQHYNDYVTGRSGAIRWTDSHMSSYIITLIAELL
ncbi:MAG: hypothetical protein ABSG28_10295 [Methanoregula sp.]|jgi:hypothetical protein|uniref:hypothetical protein n=1 Tax=Methanoregula sp. TaxID=2052170 RepID=UPI003C2570E8